jgi:hypothetical protein
MKKHILFVSTFLPSPGFGPAVINYRHLKMLKGWKTTIIADKKSVRKKYNLPSEWRIIFISQNYLTAPYFRNRLISFLGREVGEKPSAILNHFGTNSILAYHLSKKWDTPLSVILHDQWEICASAFIEKYYMKKGWAGVILNHASRIWTYSHELASTYRIQHLEKIKIISHPPERSASCFAEWRDDFKEHPVVAFAGSFRFHEACYFRLIAKALAKISGRIVLTTTKNHVVKIILSGLSNVEFREPSVDNVNLVSFLRARASCLLVPWCFELDKLPWRKAGFPAKLAEFVHTGLPTIILAPQGVPVSNWAKAHKWLGYLDTLDRKRILALLRQMTDKEMWTRMAQQSREAALGEFDPEKIQAQFELELAVT